MPRSILLVWMLSSLATCENKQVENHLFYKVPDSESGVQFENTLTNSEDFNIIEYLYFYNGGGVALGDINNDGLTDIYFSSNQQSNKLYLNKGNFRFHDITNTASAGGRGNWKTGVTMADVNGDGFLDIFICGVGNYKKFDGTNQLLINNGDLTFSDKTEEYGLTFKGFSTHASFFDYDNDGDLDMYLVNHSVHTRRSYGHASLRFQSDSLAGDRLYQNELIPRGKAHYKDVTIQAGILNSQIAYGLGVGISDVNLDGFLDIYVSNDFNENDYLYINQQNGTFKQELEKSIPHSSRFSMGNDIADINNDGFPDIVTLDMLPKDETIIKTTAGEDAYEIYEFRLRHGYHYQFSRNALQLNRGTDAENNLMFSDIAPIAGVEATDWSWAPLLADFDNDGTKDLFISNGIVGRPNDLDYINFISRDSAQLYLSDQQLFEQMPSGKVPNFFFQNNGDLHFRDVSAEWIGNEQTLSNGAAYGDLDNDGDLDLVINNINQKAFLYRNDLNHEGTNYVKLKFEGQGANRYGVGTKVIVFAGNQKMMYEQIPSKGWLSSMDYVMHIGLGELTPDSISVHWPDKRMQIIKKVELNRMRVLKQSEAVKSTTTVKDLQNRPLLVEFKDIAFTHRENSYTAFSTERLIPHMLSTQGPKIAVGDVNGDKRDDFFVCGAAGQPGNIFLQDMDGKFSPTHQPALEADAAAEDVDAAFADVDGNGTIDLLVVGGGQEFSVNNKNLLPRLYLNDGNGNFTRALQNLPDLFVNASCIEPFDMDSDGDVDLFIGGRVVPGKYGIDPPSYLMQNNGKGIFANVTEKILSAKTTLGMVTDAVWADIDRNQRPDLIVVGEWMPITVLLQNASGFFEDRTEAYGLLNTSGWWNTITSHDFDADGHIDFVVGNLGLNSRLKSSSDEPVSIVVGDIDNNNSLDQISTYYNQGKRYPFISRDQLVKQIPAMRRQFLKYSNFKDVKLDDIIDPSVQQRFVRKDAQMFASVFLKNNGDGKLIINPLPTDAQLFPIFSICVEDLDSDGNPDIIAVGNLDAVQPEFGRYDAGYGVVLMGDSKLNFTAMDAQRSGFVVRGQGRDIKTLVSKGEGKLYLVTRNNESLKAFKQAN